MNDKFNDHSINRLKKSITPNILFEILLSKFEDKKVQNYGINLNEYDLYKNSTKEGNDDDKEEELVSNCEDEINNFLPYYYKTTTIFF